jgi:hypothetical protein
MRRNSGTLSLVSRCALVGLLAFLVVVVGLGHRAGAEPELRSFPNGLPTDPDFFPIAVWLQQPGNAGKFKALGINTFVGLWHPPTEIALKQLRAHRIHLIVQPTPEAWALRDSPIIRGWLHLDEPDNAQPDGRGGYGPCISPEEIVRHYKELRARDETRPVYLGFGQGVANPGWVGRGKECASIDPETYYSAASRGGDILAFDIYPVAEVYQDHVKGRLDLVGRGVENLKRWAPPGVPIWADIETTHIKNPNRRPTPEEIRSEVWISIIKGATGINYFVHEWEPSFKEDGIFRYRDVIAALKSLNGQIRELAPVLNSPTRENVATVETAGEIAYLVKQDVTTTYIFAANMREEAVSARIKLGPDAAEEATVLDEDRTIKIADGAFEDRFDGYQVHIYRLPR